jgi:hypothetical protein
MRLKRNFLLLSSFAVSLLGCAPLVPSAESLASKAATDAASLDTVFLRNQGFIPMEPQVPERAGLPCYQKSRMDMVGRGNGIDYVEVCFDADGPIVLGGHTHGCRRQEFFPNASGDCWNGNPISASTLRRLYQ